MSRSLLILAVSALSLCAAPASAAAPVTEAARLVDCSPAERYVVFEGDIRRTRGTVRMEVRFTLQTRSPGEKKWRKVKAPGFGNWNVSSAGVKRYVYTKRLEDLVGPGSYRVKMDFRRRGARSAVIGRSHRYTPGCTVPDYRPDLVALSVVMQPSVGLTRIYEVTVRNAGLDAAGAFGLGLSINGVLQPTANLDGLAPGATDTVSIEAPACRAGSEIEFTADPRNEVDERDEDNVLRAPCPAT